MNKKQHHELLRRLANNLASRYVYFECLKDKELDSKTLYAGGSFSTLVDGEYTITLENDIMEVTLFLNISGTNVWREFKLNVKKELAIYNTDKRKGIEDLGYRIGHHRMTSGFLTALREVLERKYDALDKARGRL